MRSSRMLRKRFVCPNCDARTPLPARPFLQCAACHTISDYDWHVARTHVEWAHHQARSQAWSAQAEDKLVAAAKAHDTAAWFVTYWPILDQLIVRHPTLYPTRAEDPVYRATFVEALAMHNARLYTVPDLIKRQRQITHSTAKVPSDRRIQLAQIWPSIKMALAHFDAQDRIVREQSPGMPSDFAVGYMRRTGISMTVQEWLPYLSAAEQRELVDRLGVGDSYVDAGEGIACAYCGGIVPADTNRCPYCTADVHAQRPGLLAHQLWMSDFAFISNELRLAIKDARGPLVGFELLDGTTYQDPKRNWRMLSVRACFTDGTQYIYEGCDVPNGHRIAQTRAWTEVHAELRGVPSRIIPYREHRRGAQTARDLQEVHRRLAEAVPGATPDRIRAVSYGKGASYEVDDGGVVVRLALSEDRRLG